MRAVTGSGRRAAGWTGLACLLLFVSACAARTGGGGPGTPTTPAASDQLVLQVRFVGGFLPVDVSHANPPIVSVYADGRVITQGPVAAIYPGPALPNLQMQRISPDDVRTLVDRASAAGVRDSDDLGRPPVMDAATTRFTVVDGDHTYVRDVYALMETPHGGGVQPDPGGQDQPGPQQQAARQKLLELYQALTDLEGTLGTGHVTDAGAYTTAAVAAVVTAAHPQPQDPPQTPQRWPGPALPGEPFAHQAGVTCLTATGAEATTLLQAARQANALTPWTSPDGAQWWVRFRPLLPHETGCADLAG